MRFLDTSFVVALLRRNEQHHEAATGLWRTNAEKPVLTTQWVLGEVWTLMRRREHHEAAVRAVNALQESPSVAVVETDTAIHQAAWDWLHRHDEHVYSFVDAISFEVMRRRRIGEALAFDGDFTRAGFIEVR